MSSALYEKGPVSHVLISGVTTASRLLVTAVSQAKQRVLAVNIMVSAAAKVRFFSGSTLIAGPYSAGANGGFVLPHNPCGHFQTTAGAALRMTCSVATPCGGSLTVQKVGGKVYSIDD